MGTVWSSLSKDEQEFGETANKLSRLLAWCYRKDGVNYWYEGTPELLLKMVGYLFQSLKEDEERTNG